MAVGWTSLSATASWRFSTHSDINQNCRNAVEAASKISNSMADMNAELKMDYDEEMRFGMGIHAGETLSG